jgi:hypothetical protein
MDAHRSLQIDEMTLVRLQVLTKSRRFLERRDVTTCANRLGEIMTMVVLRSVTTQEARRYLVSIVQYTPGVRKKRPVGRRRDAS